MVWENFSIQLDDKSRQTKEQSTSVHFDNESELLPDRKYEETKRRHNRLAPKNYDNSAAWQTDKLDELMSEINTNPEGVLSMIWTYKKHIQNMLSKPIKLIRRMMKPGHEP